MAEGRKKYWSNGSIKSEIYYVNDLLHRLDGPAYIKYDEYGNIKLQDYCINGIEYTDIFKWMVETGSLKGL